MIYAIRFCHVHHCADGTNLLHMSKPTKKLNRLINFELKNLSNWFDGT